MRIVGENSWQPWLVQQRYVHLLAVGVQTLVRMRRKSMSAASRV